MKFVANNSKRPIYGMYKAVGSATLSQHLFSPGLNRVPDLVLVALMKQSGFKKLLDQGVLSGSSGDITAAKDIAQMVEDGEVTKEPVKPVAPPNSKTEGAVSGASMDEVVAKATAAKPAATAKKKPAAS